LRLRIRRTVALFDDPSLTHAGLAPLLDKAHRGFLAALAGGGRLLPGREALTFIDIDSAQKRVYGYQKEGASFGHAKIAGTNLLVTGLNPLISVISTPLAARDCGCTGKIIVRMDSAYHNVAVITAIRRNGAGYSRPWRC
jgi:hypothetical protein